jgi:hypothetical protein
MADMHSLDIVSRIDFAELDNAINNTKKAVSVRFDFKNVHTEMTIDKKEKKLAFSTDDGKMNALKEMFMSAVVKRGISVKAFDWGDTLPGAAGGVKCEAKVRSGLEQDYAKKIVKMVKESGFKVQASIQGEEIRLSGKQIDDLRSVMTMLQKAELDVPLQFVNMK